MQMDFTDALQKLTEFSLITCSREETYEVHRLVQLITYESISEEEKVMWRRTMYILSSIFPQKPDVTKINTSEIYQVYAFHVLSRWYKSSNNCVNDPKEARIFIRLSINVGFFLMKEAS